MSGINPARAETPGVEDKSDKQANKASKGPQCYTCDSLRRRKNENIAKTIPKYTNDTLCNLALETAKNKSVDYQ